MGPASGVLAFLNGTDLAAPRHVVAMAGLSYMALPASGDFCFSGGKADIAQRDGVMLHMTPAPIA